MGINAPLHLLSEMVAFAQVAERGSFSAAARALGMTPSAVSRQVARLEEALGVRLLARTTRQQRLTEAGREAFAHCAELVAAAQATLQVGQRFAAAPAGVVRLSAPKALAHQVLHPLVLELLAAQPGLEVHLVADDRDIDQVREDVDLVVRITRQPPEGLAGRPLMPVRHLLCAAPAYLAAAGMPLQPQDLPGHSCLWLGEHPRDHHWRFRRGDELAEVAVHGRYAVNHSGARLDAARRGLGIACLPDFSARAALAAGELQQVLADWEFLGPYTGQAWLLYPPDRHLPPKCRTVIDHLAARLSPTPDP